MPDYSGEARLWLTGADLKRMVEDGKAIYAYGKAQGGEPEEAMHYFMEALHGDPCKQGALRAARGNAPGCAREWSARLECFPRRDGRAKRRLNGGSKRSEVRKPGSDPKCEI